MLASRLARLVDRRDPGCHPAPRVEMSDHFHLPRSARGYQVVQYRVDRMLVENASVAVAEQVQLQTLQLETMLWRDVVDDDRAEIGLTRLGTDRREFRAGDLDLIIPIRELVGEGVHRERHVGRVLGKEQ